MIGNVAGLVIAGWLVTMPRVGAIGGFYIDAATFIVSAMLVGFMVRPVLRAPPVAGAGASPRRTVVEEIRQGVGLLAEYRPMRFVIGSFLLLMAGLGSISCVIIIFIQDAYATPTRDLGFLGMWLVVGLFGGTVLYGKFCQRWKRRMTAYGSFAAAGMGIIIFTIVVGLRMDIVFACAIAAFIGAAASPLMVIANTITHETVPEAARGRIFSSLEVVIHLSFLACMFAAAFAARHAGRSVVLVSVGILFLVAGLGGAGRERGKTTST